MFSRARQHRPGRSPVLALLVVSLTLVLAPGARALTISAGQAGIANFGQVNENFFRGAQPDRAG
jgi:hypothetical protein